VGLQRTLRYYWSMNLNRGSVLLGVAVLVLCAGCSSAPAPTQSEATTATPPDPGVADVEPAPTAPAAPQAANACQGLLIFREGLDRSTDACREGIERFQNLPPEDMSCAADADCMIYEAAGGCAGLALSTGAQARMQPLARSCGPSCWDHDFTDHRVRCDDGCCSIFEE